MRSPPFRYATALFVHLVTHSFQTFVNHFDIIVLIIKVKLDHNVKAY